MDPKSQQKPQQEVHVSVNPEKTPILYTDSVHMTTNREGLVMDVIQRIGLLQKAHIVARIGMSREHAKKFVKELSRLLIMTEGQSHTDRQPRD